MDFKTSYAGKKVLVTGHTGFKGSWLSQWLILMGADVYGYALDPEEDALFTQLGLEEELNHLTGDIRKFATFKAFLKDVEPEIIFHLAAQPLVRESYRNPLETVEVNTLGSAHVLEAVRQLGRPVAVVMITTDKCYENQEWLWGYRESDAMGGHDIYSSSKGAAEILIDSWRRSFFDPARVQVHGILVASARAGNVIGGGDWAKDRIVPDCIRSLYKGESIEVRNPRATRPWQHVLEPLGGYLLLGHLLTRKKSTLAQRARYCTGFNFGPLVTSNQSVKTLTEKIIDAWGGGEWTDASAPDATHEANLLQLTIEKAYHMLDWLPCWDFEATVEHTTTWYKKVLMETADPKTLTVQQIMTYVEETSIVNY